MIVDLSRDIFSCGTHVFVYALVHVMCLCVYVSMVCQRCMLYDDMYSHDRGSKLEIIYNLHQKAEGPCMGFCLF
jgi:hypothetical protein